jgi:hypothetical protein
MTEYEKAIMELKNTLGSESMWNVPLPALMSPEEEAAYRLNNFMKQEEIRKRIEEEEAAKRAAELEAAKSGLFGTMPEGGGVDGGRNYYVEREAQLRAANLPEDEVQSILSKEQEANNSRLAAALTLFGNAIMPGAAILGLSKYGPTGYIDYLQGNTRVMMGDTSGYQSPFTPKAAGIAAPVVSGQRNYNTLSPSAQMARDILAREAQNRAMEQVYRGNTGFRDNGTYFSSYGTTTDSGSISDAAAAGLDAARGSFGYGSNADYFGD